MALIFSRTAEKAQQESRLQICSSVSINPSPLQGAKRLEKIYHSRLDRENVPISTTTAPAATSSVEKTKKHQQQEKKKTVGETSQRRLKKPHTHTNNRHTYVGITSKLLPTESVKTVGEMSPCYWLERRY